MPHHCTVCQKDSTKLCINQGHLVRCKRYKTHTYAPSQNSRGCPYCINADAKKASREAKEAGKSKLTSAEKRKEEARLAKEAEYAKLTSGKKKEKKPSPEEAAKSTVRSRLASSPSSHHSSAWRTLPL
jgi:hypothetical protein